MCMFHLCDVACCRLFDLIFASLKYRLYLYDRMDGQQMYLGFLNASCHFSSVMSQYCFDVISYKYIKCAQPHFYNSCLSYGCLFCTIPAEKCGSAGSSNKDEKHSRAQPSQKIIACFICITIGLKRAHGFVALELKLSRDDDTPILQFFARVTNSHLKYGYILCLGNQSPDMDSSYFLSFKNDQSQELQSHLVTFYSNTMTKWD